MRLKIEIDNSIDENEIIIRCNDFSDEIKSIQSMLNDILSQKDNIIFYQDNKEYYIALEKILFFETEESGIRAHTIKDIYTVKHKLYELESMLPGYFMRVSKSTILNTNHIYSITRNISSSSIVEFQNTHKKVYVSRHYYKPLKIKLSEKRNL